MLHIEAYTDGSCKKKSTDINGIGGWGWVAYIISPTFKVTFSDWGGTLKTTNNRMELIAMAEFLEYCPQGKYVSVILYSDSMYVLGGIIGQQKIGKVCITKKSNRSWLSIWLNHS